jgi:hypothetical protein
MDLSEDDRAPRRADIATPIGEPRPSCTDGLPRMLLAGLTTCSIWSLIPLSWPWPGRGCGATGVRTAGVEGQTAHYIDDVRGIEEFLTDPPADLKSGSFTPLPVRERMTPKSGGKLRRLGIPTIRDRSRKRL